MSSKYIFLQISDLHFGDWNIGPYDADEDLRNEMKEDIRRMVRKHSFDISGILLCGDIAFSAQKKQYDVAEKFLEELRDEWKIECDKIYCVPGNHDVNQNTVKNSVIIHSLQKYLEKLSGHKLSETLGKLATEIQHEQKDYLYAPLAEYNKFAQKHNGMVGIHCPNSLDGSFPLEDGYELNIRCMNSTLVSNHEDHIKTNRNCSDNTENLEKLMIMDSNQIPKSHEKTIYMTLCHHPVNCWVDPGKRLEKKINQRAMIQLYGHTHRQSIQKSDRYISIISGALQPPEQESGEWSAQYNFICVEFENRKLTVTVYPRIWDHTENKFCSSSSECDEKTDFTIWNVNLKEEQDPDVEEKADHPDHKERDRLEGESISSEDRNRMRSIIIYYYNMSRKDRLLLGKQIDQSYTLSVSASAQELYEFVETARKRNDLEQIIRIIEDITKEE